MPKRAIDAIDRRLLAALQEDARLTVQQLAERAGLSPSPCARRVRLLEETGIIKGYVAVLDQVAVGLPVSVFASIKLERQREEELDRFAQAVARWPEVVDCYLMTGQRDYLLRIVVEDLEAYERFLKDKLTRLGGVASIESSFALGQVKRSNTLPIPHGAGR
ncbi:Lrp/AsnC family transcriptional regulator [Methylobacterium symbioticum]|uniref:DNA-binding transcriptional activator DecR n=1 Tax=Methylobacterium symbioticum TaxID=2584084 RepID=A0A509EAZ2_9HYPH|nr:Lrp/AsnC family transcriptional regulator [Methylobacterium symbioticum]VUD71330.1 DNA-binding transcriptional activator DecR [Methylobacterium symbioticum]